MTNSPISLRLAIIQVQLELAYLAGLDRFCDEVPLLASFWVVPPPPLTGVPSGGVRPLTVVHSGVPPPPSLSVQGFELGDPAQHLHPPGHPHCRAPIFDGSCAGCCPPVHGVVTLLSFDLSGGGVHALMPQRLRCMRDEGAPLSWQRVAKHGQSGRLGEAIADIHGRISLHRKA